MGKTDLGLIKDCANLWKNLEIDHHATAKSSRLACGIETAREEWLRFTLFWCAKHPELCDG